MGTCAPKRTGGGPCLASRGLPVSFVIPVLSLVIRDLRTWDESPLKQVTTSYPVHLTT